MHPLKSEKISNILPYLCCCCSRKSNQNIKSLKDVKNTVLLKHEESSAIMEEIEETDQRLDKLISDQKAKPYSGTKFDECNDGNNGASVDPFNSFGFGFIAYFKLLRYLIACFTVISLLALVNISIFSKAASFVGERNAIVASTTMGNLGYTQSLCIVQYINLESPQKLSCDRGTISSIVFNGIIPFPASTFADDTIVNNDFCGNPIKFRPEEDCSAYITAEFSTIYDADCKG